MSDTLDESLVSAGESAGPNQEPELRFDDGFLERRRESIREATERQERELQEAESRPPLSAADIKRHLDGLVIGQLEAKERLSFLLSMHQRWQPALPGIGTPPNGIIIGPTGCGKTFTIQVASAFLKIPFLTIDSTTIVPSGARSGISIDEVNDRLNSLAEGRSKAIIFFDEFDKLALRQDDNNREWKGDIQRAMLKFVEGGMATLSGTTRSLLVLAGGAFSGIDGPENIRKRRPEVSGLLRKAPKGTIVADDILNYGFMPELVARLPAIIQYEPLSENSLLKILEHKDASPLIVWRTHFGGLDKELRFSEGFLKAVAKRAATLQMGARGLQQIVFPALARHAYAFEASSHKAIEITEGLLEYGSESREVS